MIAQVVRERLHYFRVCEFQEPRTLLNQNDPNSQRGKHAGIFHSYDPAAHDDHGLRDIRHQEDLIAVDYGAIVDGDSGGGSRLGAGGDDDDVGHVVGHAARILNADMRGVDEAR